MNFSKTLWSYPTMLRLGKPLFVSGLLASLAACQSTISTPQLNAGEKFQLSSFPASTSASSIYVRHFHCSEVEEVSLRFVAVTAGEVAPIWDGTHKRVAGTSGNGCLLAMFKNNQEKPETMQIDFSFPNGQTSAGGEGHPTTLAKLSQSKGDEIPSKGEYIASEGEDVTSYVPISVTWNIPADSAISKAEPTLVRWQVGNPQTMPEIGPFESVNEILEFSRDHPELTFQVVTLQLLS